MNLETVKKEDGTLPKGLWVSWRIREWGHSGGTIPNYLSGKN